MRSAKSANRPTQPIVHGNRESSCSINADICTFGAHRSARNRGRGSFRERCNGAQHSVIQRPMRRSAHENVSRTSKAPRYVGTATSERTDQADSKTALDGHGRGGEESTGGAGAVQR